MATTESDYRTLGAAGDLEQGQPTPFYLEDKKHRVSAVSIGGKLYAFDDLCTCGGRPCPLSSGQLTGTTLMCQCHGSQFDVSTGAVLRGPATEPIVTHEAREQDGQIQVRLAG